MKLLKIFLLSCIAMVTGICGAGFTLWHNSATGAVELRQINNDNGNLTLGVTLNVVDSSNTNLVPKDIKDFTGDGIPDILLHNQNSGNLRIWEMDGAARVANTQVLGSSNTNLKIAGVGDFDGDGDNDIAVFNTNSGALRIWVMRGTLRIGNVLALSGANTNLVPSGAGDMDGDGIPDLVLRNNRSGAVRVWIMNDDFSRKSNLSIIGSSNTNLEIRGVMDINNDGNNDILNYNTNTGVLRAWLMNGNLGILANASIGQVTNLNLSARGGTNYQFITGTPLVSVSVKPYIDVVIDDMVVDFGRLDSLRRNNGAVPVGLPGNYPDPFGLHAPIQNWGVYRTPSLPIPPPPAVQGNPTASTDLKRLPIVGGVINPIQHPPGMTMVYAIVADADGGSIEAEFVLPVPIMGKGNFYTAIDLDMEGGVPAGTLIDSYETLAAYNDMLTRYANLGWLSTQPHQVNPASPLPYNSPPPLPDINASTIEPTLITVDLYTGPYTFIKEPKEFPYIIGFNGGGVEKINVGDIVMEAINPAGLQPSGKVHKVIMVGGSWAGGDAIGYLWMIPVLNDFWDWRHTGAAVPRLFLDGDQVATVSYVGQALPIIWEAPDDPDVEETTRDRRYIYPDVIPRGGVINIEAKVTDNSTPKEKAFDWVAYPLPTPTPLSYGAYANYADDSNFTDCNDRDRDGYFAEIGCKTEVDCDDENPEINPGATEICDDQKDNDCNDKIDCSDTACTNDPACITEGKVWRLVEIVKSGDYIFEDVFENIEGDPCEIHESHILDQNTIKYHFYHKGKGCGRHIDITGYIEFEVPPTQVIPNKQAPLDLSGSIGGYKSAMADGVAFVYYLNGGFSPQLNSLAMTIENCGDVREVTAGGFTFDGWECSYTDAVPKSYTFPGENINKFFIEGRGGRGVGIQWHYELVDR